MSPKSLVPIEAAQIYRAKWPETARLVYFKEHPENFAGPDMGYPIKDAGDVRDAWDLAGHAGDPDAVRAKIKEIAGRLGLTSGLPDTATSERSIALDTSSKEHMDPIDNKDLVERAVSAPDALYYAPITRINREKREVVGTATAEVKDAYKTVIGYEASKAALAAWPGNIREMHINKAVGRALEIKPDDDNKRIIVRARISKGAQDTWEKVLDGTLRGFSIGGRNGVWTKRMIDGEELPYLERYDAVELSLVDNYACPGCKIEVVRADGFVDGVLAQDDEIGATPEIARNDTVERAGATISAATREGMHGVRDQLCSAHKQAASNCGCDECQSHVDALSKIGADDGDERTQIAEIVRAEIAKAVQAQISPVIQRVNALLAHDAGRSEAPDFTRNFTAIDTRHDALATKLNDIETLVQRIADQPAVGGPILHGADKRIATQAASPQYTNDDAAIIRRATQLGMAPPADPQAAVRAAAAVLSAQQRLS